MNKFNDNKIKSHIIHYKLLQMSLTFQQIILDAKKLVIRISDHENTADNLISEVESVCSQIDNMKQVNRII